MVKIWADSSLEDKLSSHGICIIAGADEVGRGAWAGPLIVACVVLSPNFNTRVCDSKFLTSKQRLDLFSKFEKNLVCSSTGSVEADEIDEFGLAESLRLCYI